MCGNPASILGTLPSGSDRDRLEYVEQTCNINNSVDFNTYGRNSETFIEFMYLHIT